MADFKNAIVKTLLKSGAWIPTTSKSTDLSNLPFLSKLAEKTVPRQLQDHLKSEDLYDPLQSAYRSGHSSETALTV